MIPMSADRSLISPHTLDYDGVEDDARRVLRDLTPFEIEVLTKDGRWLMMRLRPYRTLENRIEGIVLSFVEITSRRTAEEQLRLSEERYRNLFMAMEDGFFLIERTPGADDDHLMLVEANPSAARLIGKPLTSGRLEDVRRRVRRQLCCPRPDIVPDRETRNV